jgi:rhodanese-related sulfurtransferase
MAPIQSNNIDHPVLTKLPQKIKDEIAKMAEEKIVSAGDIVFSQGDPGDSFFMIKSGSLRVFRKTAETIETDLAVLGPGDSFGEIALLTGAPRSATVEAISDARLITLSKEQFDKILKGYPEVSLTLIKQMSSWLVDNNLMLEQEQTFQYRQPKLSISDFVFIIFLSCFCAIIFNHSNPNGITLFPKTELNSMIGHISPEMAIHELTSGKAHFVDAMPPVLYDKEHIAGATNLPLSVFDIMYLVNLTDVDKSKKIIVYGGTISRRYDVEVANKLFLQGHKNIQILEGGLSSWKKKSYPVEP